MAEPTPEQQTQGLDVAAKLDTLTHDLGQSNSPEARQITEAARNKALSAALGHEVTVTEKPIASLNLTGDEKKRIDDLRTQLSNRR